mmetsp:Transcript_23358/g.48531  ORF Transcript_23358/g.48531 Transcript_23358/m.48531 type:complete len:211 (+) Transcript_23358:60-692(+)
MNTATCTTRHGRPLSPHSPPGAGSPVHEARLSPDEEVVYRAERWLLLSLLVKRLFLSRLDVIHVLLGGVSGQLEVLVRVDLVETEGDDNVDHGTWRLDGDEDQLVEEDLELQLLHPLLAVVNLGKACHGPQSLLPHVLLVREPLIGVHNDSHGPSLPELGANGHVVAEVSDGSAAPPLYLVALGVGCHGRNKGLDAVDGDDVPRIQALAS